jgi:para-aminobenzoate synthetase component 1
VFLDSGRPFGRPPAGGRYDIMAAEPLATLVTQGALTDVRMADRTTCSPDDPLDLLREALAPLAGASGPFPFTGGAIGYFAYDLARRFERMPSLAADPFGLPELALGIYDWALVVDHERRRSHLVGGRLPETRARWREISGRLRNPPPAGRRRAFRAHGPVCRHLSRARYVAAFNRVRSYIRAGDCYQVNLAQRFSIAAEGDPWAAYRALRAASPAPHGAYLNLPFGQILSNSPERFLRVRGGAVETCPIKGTAPRGGDPRSDSRSADALRASAKDRAENVMIVDLLRNDLGKVCRVGSIAVPTLCALESFPTVHHLVSEVRGTLAPGRDALDVLRACFPGGSVTGAPKRRAMQIIEELEPERRGVYCGAIGYLGPDGDMDTSIAIRTAVHQRGTLSFHGGGGIVADSAAEAEYRETLDKVAAFLRLADSSAGAFSLDDSAVVGTN